MASKWLLCIVIAVFTSHLTYAFIILNNPDCHHSDNELILPNPKCSWLEKACKSLPKYRNFFAGLLQEENEEFAYELQEIYNVISAAMADSDRKKTRKNLMVAKWMMESNKKLYEFLLKKNIWKI